ncbi:MAG: Undecaprenyl-diphosphatase [candidate division WS6 bacterium 34_10]|uniref:Undecaprenyl-diphosphatase n=1 Tax=candidate division WS6 bacterium 34_10 TaxID=1641389 RepID=A0A117LZU1_9BACT|nr:MAG: Undecaprenyl-diphosphatase [candidate division WS6 bacterium 34_10]
MNTLKMIILSIVQGITEVLPISSSGHLILTGKFLDFDISGDLFFLSILHLGTTLAVVLFYRKILFKNFFTKEKWIFFLKLALASLPAALAGVFLQDYIASTLHGTKIIAISLIVVGVLFILFENILKNGKVEETEKLPLWKMILIGVGQTLALIPGTSRSGITTLTGMMLGLDKYSAFNFSFILGIPILLGSSLYEILKEYLAVTTPSFFTASVVVAKTAPFILITFVIGYFALLLVSKFKKSKWLTVFGTYRILLGILILLLAI